MEEDDHGCADSDDDEGWMASMSHAECMVEGHMSYAENSIDLSWTEADYDEVAEAACNQIQ